MIRLPSGISLARRRSGGAPTPTPTPTPTPAPSWSVNPSISGSAVVGQTLTGSDGTISNGTVSARAWLRNGSAISGATGGTYLLVGADEGANIAYRVTATGAGGSANATSAVVGPVTVEPSISAVAADGWQATMPTPVDLAFDPVSVSREGYDSAGNTATISETLLTTKRVRQPYPNEGSFTTDQVALSDYVYSTDTIAGVTNNSTETSPKPVANWSIVDRRIVGNSLYLEIVAFHRNGVACVEFSATDGTNTVTAKTATPIVSGQTGDAGAVIVYAATLDITSLNDNANITCNAKVYPRIGAAASVLDSAASAVARAFSPRVWRKNTSRFAAPPLVYIASGGNNTTGYVGTDAGLAAASPCLTLTGAINRARTVLGTGAGSLDGLRVRFTAGTWSLSASPTSNTVNAAVVFEPAPGVAKADVTWSVGAANLSTNLTYTRWLGLTISRAGVNTLFSTSGGHCTIDGCDLNNNSQGAALGSTANTGFFLTGGVVITNWNQNQPLGAGTAEMRMVRGVSGGTANAGLSVEGWLVLGSALIGPRFLYGTRPSSGAILHGNMLTRLGSAGGGVLSNGTDNMVGTAVVQNVFEYTSTSSQPSFRPSSDSDTIDTSHLICWHNTFAGFDTYGRLNALYDDTVGDPRSHKLHSFIGNVQVQINTKHDVFMSDGTRVGGWSYLYGVGQRGEFSRYRDAGGGSWLQEYPGAGSVIGTSNTGAGNDPLFTSPAHTTSGPVAGAGGGNYVLQGGSPARGLLTEAPVAFDFAGAARSGTVAAGAYL